METVGIICEYNPFHNGHLYHIKEIKKMFKNSTIILVMSGNFTQRGDSSLINKWNKTEIALKNNIDIVVELPFEFTVQGADDFAYAAVRLLTELKVNYLVFGSESNDVEKLKKVAYSQLDKDYQNKVKLEIKKGINYAQALNNALDEKITEPNDILALSYIREIIKQKSNIIPISIKRTNSYHEKTLSNQITSATSIRENINKIDIKKYVPDTTYKYLNDKISFTEDYYKFLKYKIISEINNLDVYEDVDEGIENKIKKEIFNSNTFDELIKNIKSKRYTYSKLKRMLIHILVGYTKEENKKKEISYIRILGFNKKGQKYLNLIKKEVKLPIYTKFNKTLENELKITSIYSCIFDNKYKKELFEKEIKGLIKL